MKRFNIIHERTRLYGRNIPINACIGEFTTTYRNKGKVCHRTVIYMVDDFRTYRNHVVDPFAEVKLYHYNYRINVYDGKNGRWYKTHTDQPSLRPLANFLTKMFYKLGIDENTQVEYYTTNKQIHGIAPKERKINNKYIYKPTNRPINTKDWDYDGLPHIDVIPHWSEGNERQNYNHFSSNKKHHKSNELKEPVRLYKSIEHYNKCNGTNL